MGHDRAGYLGHDRAGYSGHGRAEDRQGFRAGFSLEFLGFLVVGFCFVFSALVSGSWVLCFGFGLGVGFCFLGFGFKIIKRIKALYWLFFLVPLSPFGVYWVGAQGILDFFE